MNPELSLSASPDDRAYFALVTDDSVTEAIEARVRARRVPDCDVEDFVQDVRSALVTATPRPATLREVVVLARKIAGDVVTDAQRRHARRAKHHAGLTDAADDHAARKYADAGPEAAVELREKIDVLRRLVERGEIKEIDVTLLSMSAQEYTGAEMAVACDTTEKNAHNRVARARLKWQKALPLASVLLFVMMAAYFAWKERQTQATPRPAPRVDDSHQVAPAPAPAPDASALREEARAACASFEWARCSAKLDAAAALDPTSDLRSDVVSLRQEIYDGTHPRKGPDKPVAWPRGR